MSSRTAAESWLGGQESEASENEPVVEKVNTAGYMGRGLSMYWHAHV